MAADKGLSKLGKMAKGTKVLGRTEDVAKAAVKAEDVIADSLDDLVNTSRKSTKMAWDERGVGIRKTSYAQSSPKFETTADLLKNIECRNGKVYTSKVTIDKIGHSR